MIHHEILVKTKVSSETILDSHELIMIKFHNFELNSKELNETCFRSKSCFLIKPVEKPSSKRLRNKQANLIISAIRKFLYSLKFRRDLFLNNLYSKITHSASIIINAFKKFYFRTSFRKSKLIESMRTQVINSTIKIQSACRKFLQRIIYGEIVANLRSNHYLILGDSDRQLNFHIDKLRLVKYDVVEGEDQMTYYEFSYSKEIRQFYLFIPKNDIHRENTLVNFYADGHLIKNSNFPTIYKNANIFYNILNLSELRKKQLESRNLTLQKQNSSSSAGLYDPQTYRRSNKKFLTTLSYSKIHLSKNNTDKKGKKVNSSRNLTEIVRFTPILKSPSQNILYSSQNNKKKVQFNF